jgi:SAM-dependent methyltransferase
MANGSIFNRKRSLLRRIVDLAIASPYRNPITTTNLAHFIDHLPDTTGKPTVLVIGGGTVGNGMTALYDHPAIDVVAFDIYASGETDFVADAHAIPLKSGTIAGVWIQAVLEHVLEPVKVVAEIQRVLQPEGIVYAETPFMQQVHEQAYDFTRFTESGHRWLFKEFHLIDSGVVSGPGTVLIWAIRQFFAALFQNQKIGSLSSYLFFWLGFCDRWMPRSYASDGASAVFFLGRKAHQPISPRDAIAFYQGVQ